MAARLLLGLRPLPCRTRAWRQYATAAALATEKRPQKPASKGRSPAAATPKAPVQPLSSRSRRIQLPDDNPKPQVSSAEAQVENLERLIAFGRQMPTADVWGQKVDTLDVIIPRPVLSHFRQVGLSGLWSRFWDNRWNDVKSMLGLYALASGNAIPGIITADVPWYTRWFVWPFYAFTSQSTSPKSWLTICRQMILDTYKELNTAVAKKDVQVIKRLATDSYLYDTLVAQKKRKHLAYIWRFHREVNPAKIVSLRVIEGYLSPEEPKFGSRWLVHALVKFDTEQSLEIYDQRGNALHKRSEGALVAWDGRVPAEKQHVIQYFVMEKRMWYDGPWLVREQIWDVNAKKTD